MATEYELYPEAAWALAEQLNIQRSLTVKERASIDDSDFAWPDAPGGKPLYPADTQDHLDALAKLIGRAPENMQATIKARAIKIAKKNNLTLPATWQEDSPDADKEKDRMSTPEVTRAAASHPFDGSHVHSHPAFQSQGDDATHEHEHSHSNDSNHDHDHPSDESDSGDSDTQNATRPEVTRSAEPEDTHLYVPIERIDKQKREIYGRATIEDLDAYKTIFSYEGSKRAFTKWMNTFGNLREMHDDKRAVGKAVRVKFDDEQKQVLVRARVSKSADGDNAWTKIQEGILNGFSVGAAQCVWDKIERNGKTYPYLQDYELVELSIVDRPATPGCTIQVARSDGFISNVIEAEEDELETPSHRQPDDIRVGARVSADTRTALHSARDHALQGAQSAMQSCNCASCQSALDALDPDGDGDIDIVASLDTDNDAAGGNGDGSGVMNAMLAELTRQIAPTLQRMNGIAARLAATDINPTITQNSDPEVTRRLGDLEVRLSGLDEVRSLVSEVKGLAEQNNRLVELMAAQPQVGGPIINSSALRNQPAFGAYDPGDMERQVVERLARGGILKSMQQQTEAVMFLERQRLERTAGR